MADPYGGWGSPSFGYTTPGITRRLRSRGTYARGQYEPFGEQFEGYLWQSDADFRGSHYDLTPNWRIWPIEYAELMARDPYLWPMNITIEQYPGVETDIEWLVSREIPAFDSHGFPLWFLGASIDGLMWMLGAGRYIPLGPNVLQLAYRGARAGASATYIISKDPIIRNAASKAIFKTMRPYYNMFKRLGVDRAIKWLERQPSKLKAIGDARKGSYTKHIDSRAKGMKAWRKAEQLAQAKVILRRTTKGNRKSSASWFDELQEVFEGYPTPLRVSGKAITASVKLPKVRPVIKTLDDVVQTGKYYNRGEFLADLFATVQNGIMRMPQQLLDNVRNDIQDAIGDEMREQDMPYIRKWVPYIRRRRRYGRRFYGGGYRPRRRTYRRY